jgi:hypothetical protein
MSSDASNSSLAENQSGELTLKVAEFTDARAAEWDQFVLAHPSGTVFHMTPWKRVIERSFGYAAKYLLAERDGKICGVLPLFLVKNLIIGKTLISTPFGVYGGICAADAESYAALQDAACE